ncbi:MAG: maltose ABC transporter permease MalF [Deltaproteobacteria bacterium]|nr:maltose ABC transporter permease MalF [Deltaproteobacteria bacterium]
MFGKIVKGVAITLLAAVLLYLVGLIYIRGNPLWAVSFLALLVFTFYIFLAPRAYNYRYLFPGLAGIAIFVVFPLLYTVQIGFTNYSAVNLLSFDRAKKYLLDETVRKEGSGMHFSLYQDNEEYWLVLQPMQNEDDETTAEQADIDSNKQSFITSRIKLLTATLKQPLDAVLQKNDTKQTNEPLPISRIIKLRQALSNIKVRLPDGEILSYAGIREFAFMQSVYTEGPENSLNKRATGETIKPNFDTGFFETTAGARLSPGFKVGIGINNYIRMATDPEFRRPFFYIFIWTVVFAGLTVFFTLAVGFTLAVILNWPSLRFSTMYRTLLFLPYAVPGFISILIFKGLFNANFGEINIILNALFGIKPQWFADATLAKIMILIVNTWLGYPYIMILCMGFIKAIPYDLYEASAIAGAGPLTNFFKITLPLTIKPLMPLLIASFAFNFNNFVLISLLTTGRPDFLNTHVPAGTTDILVSYTYRIAFEDSGQNFGLAAAISTVIFVMVALLSILNLKLTRVNQQESR